MSDRGRIHFVNDLECAAFLWRHLSSRYETRTLTLIKHADIIDRMEKRTAWRLSEDSLRGLFEDLLSTDEVASFISSAASRLHCCVEEDQEAGWLCELLPSLVVERTGPKTLSAFARCTPKLKEHLDLLLCLLSSTVDQSDPFSATRLLSSIAPSCLPGLRKRAAATKLNLVQALLSYSMTARIHEAGQEDEILSQSMDLLKRFDRTIDEMHEKMHELDDVNRSLSSMLTSATNFLLTTEQYQNDGAGIRKAQSLIQQELKQLIANQKTMEGVVACRNEDAPDYLTRRDRVARALLDRFTALEISGATGADIAMTPAFKTPQMAARVEVEEATQSIDENCETTPKRATEENTEHKWFISNATPTPKRDGPTIYEELLDEEKENMGPFKKVTEEGEMSENEPKRDKEQARTPLAEQTTPVRSRPSLGGLRIRPANADNRPTAAKNNGKDEKEKPRRRSKGAEGDAKRSKPLAAGQTSLTRFFGKPVN